MTKPSAKSWTMAGSFASRTEGFRTRIENRKKKLDLPTDGVAIPRMKEPEPYPWDCHAIRGYVWDACWVHLGCGCRQRTTSVSSSAAHRKSLLPPRQARRGAKSC